MRPIHCSFVIALAAACREPAPPELIVPPVQDDASAGGDGDGSDDGDPATSSTGAPPEVPDLPGDCEAGARRCSDDGFANQWCGWNPEAFQADWGWRVPCDAGQSCESGVCAVGECRTPEVLFVVDRSDSLLEDDRWLWVADEVSAFSSKIRASATQGLRMFPDEPCEPGDIAPIETRADGIGPLLVAPTQGASTPIRAALADTAAVFGDPDQHQVVILITDGDETCEPNQSPALVASSLYRLGIRVFAIGVSTQANVGLLDEIAALGGTGEARIVDSGAALADALTAIEAELGACVCDPGSTTCFDGVVSTCDDAGTGYVASEACPTGQCDGDACVPVDCEWFCDVAQSSAAIDACVSEVLYDDYECSSYCSSCVGYGAIDDAACAAIATQCL
jgi:hypothetical protein